jgi:hypothetical protein
VGESKGSEQNHSNRKAQTNNVSLGPTKDCHSTASAVGKGEAGKESGLTDTKPD